MLAKSSLKRLARPCVRLSRAGSLGKKSKKGLKTTLSIWIRGEYSSGGRIIIYALFVRSNENEVSPSCPVIDSITIQLNLLGGGTISIGRYLSRYA